MMTIKRDTTKFSRLGPIDTYDHNVSIETKFQMNLVKWIMSGLLPSTISDLIKPVGSIHPSFYGLSKTPQDGVSLRSIPFIIDSSQHKVAKLLTTILQPVLNY